MNERIKELATQAGIEFTYDPTETPVRAFIEAWEDDLAKFTELIVRECCTICDSFSEECSLEKTHSDVIKEHFGVEE